MERYPRLGKLRAVHDVRTLKLKDVLSDTLPPIPETFDLDQVLGAKIPLQVFGNDRYGDCVIAGRANWTLRAEYFEQKQVLPISTADCLAEYWKEQGWNGFWCSPKPDNGLVMLDSLKAWRQQGWMANNKLYSIYAFGKINWLDHDEVRAVMYLLSGSYSGLALPISAKKQWENGQIWDVVDGPDGQYASWGYHCVYSKKVTTIGPCFLTWGAEVQATWAFWDKYTDEDYGIVDNVDKWVENSPVDKNKLMSYLQSIEEG